MDCIGANQGLMLESARSTPQDVNRTDSSTVGVDSRCQCATEPTGQKRLRGLALFFLQRTDANERLAAEPVLLRCKGR
jgi:hypothetical protein